ncbi:MAG: class I SAM-dependent methyltransferase [Candidatus Thorarchaeota archaeon]
MSSFDNLAIAYDNSIDWNARLERELPFILSSFRKDDDRRVLDIACGSGRHSIALAIDGANVVGVDMSSEMIAVADALAKKNSVNPDFRVLDMADLGNSVNGPFDLVLCLGNSLALSPNRAALGKLLGAVSDLLHRDGSFICQVLNFEAVRKSSARYFPSKGGKLDSGEEVVFTRFFDSLEKSEKTTLVLSSFIKTNTEWKSTLSYQEVLQLDLDILQDLFTAARLKADYYSDYAQSSFDRETHRNIVIRAQRN